MPATKTFAGLTLYVPSATGLRVSGPTVGLDPGRQVAVPDGAVGVGVGVAPLAVGAGVAPVGAGVAPVGVAVAVGAWEDAGLGVGAVPVAIVVLAVVAVGAGCGPIVVPEAHATSKATPKSQQPRAPRSAAARFTRRARPSCAAPERASAESRRPGRPG